MVYLILGFNNIIYGDRIGGILVIFKREYNGLLVKLWFD